MKTERKKKVLLTIDIKEKHQQLMAPHTQRAVPTFVIPESLAMCQFGTVSPMRT